MALCRGFRRLKNTIIVMEWVPRPEELSEGADATSIHLQELTTDKEADLQASAGAMGCAGPLHAAALAALLWYGAETRDIVTLHVYRNAAEFC